MYTAIDLFSGCGGLSTGLELAGFSVIAAVEIDKIAADTYKLNHPDTKVFVENIRELSTDEIKTMLNGRELNLLAGCPPCQGFSSMRKLNRKDYIRDNRNTLIEQYYRFVKDLKPQTIMLENVPGLADYYLFKQIVRQLQKDGYYIVYKVINVANYSVPQRRKRLIMVGSRLGVIDTALASNTVTTVRMAFQNKVLDNDILDTIYPHHIPRIQDMIKLIPKNGGSMSDLPSEYQLECHKKSNVGFHDVYGRLKWDDVSSTITGGCLNPSKGRFLHPEENRCISAREAALLQTFPPKYIFPVDIPKTKLALMIGNALPPEFSRIQAENIFNHLRVNKIN